MGKRRRKCPDSELTPEEAKRRRLQREKQQIALQRQAGKNVPSKQMQKAAAWRAELAEKASADKKEATAKREELGAKHDVVIVPIFWKQREEETAEIQRWAQNIKTRLAACKVDCWIDNRHKYTPGQKFAYWEHLGVMTRIELGPADLPKSTCSLCKVHKAGDYKGATRKKDVSLGGQALFNALRELGLTQLTGKEDVSAPNLRNGKADARAALATVDTTAGSSSTSTGGGSSSGGGAAASDAAAPAKKELTSKERRMIKRAEERAAAERAAAEAKKAGGGGADSDSDSSSSSSSSDSDDDDGEDNAPAPVPAQASSKPAKKGPPKVVKF